MPSAREKYEQFEEAAQERLKEGKERFAEFEADAGARLKRGAKHADEVVHEKTILCDGFCRIGRFGCRCVVEPPLMRIC